MIKPIGNAVTGNTINKTQAPEERVLELLRESGAMLEGHFLLSSGRHSDRYFQCARLLQYPDRAAEALAATAERIKADMGKLALDAVVGPAMGGIITAWEMGRQLGLRSFFTERDESGEMTLRRGFEIKPGERILIVEDVITTGKSFGECSAVLEKLGAEIAALACVVDRRAMAPVHPAAPATVKPAPATPAVVPWPLYAACRVEAQNWEPESCELCRQGIPVVKHGSRKNITP
jgi:orotate phosphoribosyltransferase